MPYLSSRLISVTHQNTASDTTFTSLVKITGKGIVTNGIIFKTNSSGGGDVSQIKFVVDGIPMLVGPESMGIDYLPLIKNLVFRESFEILTLIKYSTVLNLKFSYAIEVAN